MKTVKKLKRSTRLQLQILLNYMTNHKEFAYSQDHGILHQQEWARLAGRLNERGPDKTITQWKQTWRDIKRRIRNRDEDKPIKKIPSACIRSTPQQIELLKNYMSTHQKFATSTSEYRSPMMVRQHNEEWAHLMERLAEKGPNKSLEQWKQVWRDLRRKSRQNQMLETTSDPGSPESSDISSTPMITGVFPCEGSEKRIIRNRDDDKPIKKIPSACIRSTPQQIELLKNYMSTHQKFATSTSEYRSPMMVRQHNEEWAHLMERLAEKGPNKSLEQWKQATPEKWLGRRGPNYFTHITNPQDDIMERGPKLNILPETRIVVWRDLRRKSRQNQMLETTSDPGSPESSDISSPKITGVFLCEGSESPKIEQILLDESGNENNSENISETPENVPQQLLDLSEERNCLLAELVRLGKENNSLRREQISILREQTRIAKRPRIGRRLYQL